MRISNLTGRVDPVVESTIREMQIAINELTKNITAAKASIPTPPSFKDIAEALSVSGDNPLNVNGLLGQLYQSQKASVPSSGGSGGSTGPLTIQNDQLYVNGNPVGALGIVLYDTHANKNNYSAGGYPVGILYFETDRGVFYLNTGSYGASQWTFATGVMVSPAANRPADLGSTDVGFLFIAIDTSTISYWTGTSWTTV